VTPELLATIRRKIASSCALQWPEADALLRERDELAEELRHAKALIGGLRSSSATPR
jgi:hypothetical protein